MSSKFGSCASTDAAVERRTRGQLFDIVKIEERETWTARFLRSGRETGQHDKIDGTFSQEVHTIADELRFVGSVCVLVNVHREMRTQNVQMSSDKSDIKLESLILAQNERWRQA